MGEEKEKPLTREDVLRLIEEHGGTAKGLDLSGKEFESGIDLRGINNNNLQGIILNEAVLEESHLEGVQLIHAHFEGAFMSDAHLEGIRASGVHFERAELVSAHLEQACLAGAHLEGAEFFDAHLEEANLTNSFLEGGRLSGAHLQGVHLFNAHFSTNTQMESIDWGDFILGEEQDAEKEGRRYKLRLAEATYRRLKQWYTDAGVYDIAGEFFFREMTAQRKGIKWWPHPTHRKKINWWLHPRHRAWSKFVSLICGYGERPHKVIIWAASVVLGLAFIYFIIGSTWDWAVFLRYLYFSAVSFTALGYGSWLEITNDWIKGIGAFESFIGVFTIALFLITFTRKMRR